MSRASVQAFDALAVPLTSGVTLIEASAGTGKTFAITRLVLRLLLEQRVASLSEILVVTFTDKATQELVTRIRAVLRLADQIWSDTPPPEDEGTRDLFTLRRTHGDPGGAIIRAALASLDDLGVSTIHGFCTRVLAESALETHLPFRTTFVEDETEPLVRAAMDWSRQRLLTDPGAATRFVAARADLGGMVEQFVRPYRRHPDTTLDYSVTDAGQATVSDFVTSVSGTFDREKRRRHLLGFDDLLRTLSRVLTTEGPDGPLAQRIRSRYRAALIDEFQDTDNTQFPIFRTAFTGCPLFLIGDPKQSIYRFRGADIDAYLGAAAAADARYTLTQNFRSSAACVKAVEQLFTREAKPFLYDESRIGFPRVTAARTPVPKGTLATDGCGAMVWWWIDQSLGTRGYVAKDKALAMILDATVAEIVRLTAEGLPHGCIAVLLRSNRVARRMKEALDAAGVPAVIGGADDVLTSDEADELVRLAAAMASPYDHRAVAAALATRLWGSSASEIAAAVADGGDAVWGRITARFADYRDTWRARGVSAAFGALLSDAQATERLLMLPDGERRLTNVRHVIELLHRATVDEAVTVEGVEAWVQRERSVANTPERRMQRLETDAAAVQILTMHKAKGLEFDVVFCPTLYDTTPLRAGPFGIAPVSVREDDRDILDLGSPLYDGRADAMLQEERAEALRLTYVALTRAVHRCYIAVGDIGQGNAAAGSALGYLLRPSRDGGTMRSVVEQLVHDSEGTMTFQPLGDRSAPVPRVDRTDAEARDFTARTLTLGARQLETWRPTSFTGLVVDAPETASRDVADPALLPEVYVPPTGFRAFPAGAQAGVALHDIFERLDFARTDDDEVRATVQSSLQAHGLTGDATIAAQRLDDVVRMVQRTCAATIPGTDIALRDVPWGDTLREWRFDLSVASTSVRRIADALMAHGSPHARAYAPRLRALREQALPGYLGGVIDLAFSRNGTWWIVDWKSNQLGAADARYRPGILGDVMMEAHYTLQYHLYALALHRFLRTRLAGYDPVTHWGGVAYAFLRGIGEDDPSRGWFLDRPSPALLDALDVAVGRRQ